MVIVLGSIVEYICRTSALWQRVGTSLRLSSNAQWILLLIVDFGSFLNQARAKAKLFRPVRRYEKARQASRMAFLWRAKPKKCRSGLRTVFSKASRRLPSICGPAEEQVARLLYLGIPVIRHGPRYAVSTDHNKLTVLCKICASTVYLYLGSINYTTM